MNINKDTYQIFSAEGNQILELDIAKPIQVLQPKI